MMRSKASTNSTTRTTSPVSSLSSRTTAASRVSPNSTAPPGSDHCPASGSLARCTRRTRGARVPTAPQPPPRPRGLFAPPRHLPPHPLHHFVVDAQSPPHVLDRDALVVAMHGGLL